MKILMIGDIVGRPGRHCLRDLLPRIIEKNKIDFVIANCENAASGKGATKKVINNIFSSGVNVMTSGNHIWDKREIYEFIDQEENLLRPANYPPGTPGRGFGLYKVDDYVIGVLNLSGRVFMQELDCPFQKAIEVVNQRKSECTHIIVDFHAEATSEKMALARYLDGKVSALIGTHTHVQTADEHILPNGTGYLTDVGMTGPYNSILGVDSDAVINKFITQLPERFEVADGGAQFNGVFIDLEIDSGLCKNIERIQDVHDF